MFRKGFTIGILLFSICQFGFGQMDTVRLKNGSFEDQPHAGGGGFSGIRGWFDCGRINFPNESPPDIHPGNIWKNKIPPSHGETYLGLVVRDNDSWESVSQRLPQVLESDKCYEFSIELARSPQYWSISRVTEEEANYDNPTLLRIWGGLGYCNCQELLAESSLVRHSEWQTYTFNIKSTVPVTSITFEAFYKTPVLFPYIGNILVDNATSFIQVPCPGEEILAEVSKKPLKKKIPPHKRKKKPPVVVKKKDPVVASVPPPAAKPKIMEELDRSKLKKGQTIRIEKLFFKADKSDLSEDSYEVLDEIYQFLSSNDDIKVEIGGHTNGRPTSNEFCDSLSTERAKTVATYLVQKGIVASRLHFKGYGKRKPIASNKTFKGRQKNQRVEIKILSFDS